MGKTFPCCLRPTTHNLTNRDVGVTLCAVGNGFPTPHNLQPTTNQGAVAQLGERLICTQEAAGSIPTSSTSGPVAQLVRARP